MGKKKWQITDLDNNLEFSRAGGIILKNRLNQVIEDVEKYFDYESAEALHRVRISLRRLRYSMELFISIYDIKIFMILYKKVTKLQDLSGMVRDFDVMEENMISLVKKENIKIPRKVLSKVDDLRNGYRDKLKTELLKFTKSKAVKNFRGVLY
jgi:CHAD domain-containing protein